ncbi:MAG: wax ester/triacylglycerol synthase family O-acyltransferase [Acidobacteria bacterium]|nr:MAG: wax ester/triacylglycerol synthase family O-acyltransferase [Acidobacteriota bacterium]
MVLGFGKGEPLSNVDAAWLHMEDRTNLMVITAVMAFHEPLDFNDVKTIIEDRFLCYDRFRQRVVEGGPLTGPRWVDDEHFNLKSHLIRLGLPKPAGKAELEELVSSLASAPLDPTKPLWQFHFIDNYRGGSALIWRIHHCIGDGIALIRVLLSMTDDSPTGHKPSKKRRRRRRTQAAGFWLPEVVNDAFYTVRKITGEVVESGVEALTTPGKLMSLANEGAQAAGVLARLASMPADPKTCFKGPLATQKRCAWSEIMPLETVRAFGKEVGATINDVLLAGVCGALRHYLIDCRQGDLDGMDIRATVPVNLRPEGPPGELGNMFGLVFLSLPVGLPTRMARLRKLKQRMDRIKRSSEAVVTFGVLNAVGMASAEVEGAAIGFFGAKATAVMTNVPGPKKEIYFAGKAVRSMMFWVPQAAHLGLGVSILSYAGQVRLGVISDAGLVPRPADIIEYFEKEMNAFIENPAE